MEFRHTEWVRGNLTTAQGWGEDPPAGTLALVSGFPELVTEGVVRTCADPTSTSCFPDRSDMKDRHPRTAMGLTEDRRTLIFAVVDGRRSSSSGMRGAELADLMGQLGAWQAYNLDGGGSTTMWLADRGTVNRPSDGSPRSVANHWAVFAGAGRAGHCETAAPCQELPAEGGVIDDSSACFRTFGPQEYWREEAAGHGGHLFWTNAWETDLPADWAWWQIHLAEAGEYRVEYWAEPGFAVFDETRYRVVAGDVETELVVDQSAGNGWTELGTFDFAAGGDQLVALYDDADHDIASGQHIVADAIRLVRLDLPEDPEDPEDPGDTGDDGSDTGDPDMRDRAGRPAATR